MKNQAIPLAFAVFALLAVFQPGGSGSGKSASAGQGEPAGSAVRATPEPGQEKKGTTISASEGWQEPIRLYREFFGVEEGKTSKTELKLERGRKGPGDRQEYVLVSQREQGSSDLSLEAESIRNRKSGRGYLLEFMIALVPDPVESNLAESFDRTIESIKGGFHESGYLLDSFWLPWANQADKSGACRKAPGLLLFRRAGTMKGPPRLMGVFLIGETPKKGIHKAAFENALEIVRKLSGKPVLENPLRVRVLGPFFSGSAESLAIAVRRHPLDDFQIRTGSALAWNVESRLASLPGVEFHRSVIPQKYLQEKGIQFFERLGWDPKKIAVLTEYDTAYGDDRELEKLEMMSDFLLAHFPSGISDLRTAWEMSGRVVEGKAPLSVPKVTLDLSLADPGKPVDIIPEFSSLSARSHELVIANILAAISREGIRYVGIQATDVRDTLFLARKIRLYAPDTILFTFDNHLLSTHPQYRNDMDGMLVISNFPLLPEGLSFASVLGRPRGKPLRFRRQFASDFQEGVFRATVELIGDPEARGGLGEKRIWIAAIGNGSLWPIASLPEASASPGSGSGLKFERISTRGLFNLSLLFVALVLAAWWLREVAPPPECASEGRRFPLALGYAAEGLLFTVATLVATLPWWHDWRPAAPYVVLVAGTMAIPAWRTFQQTSPWVTWKSLPWLLALGALLALPVLLWGLKSFWLTGEAEFFVLRAGKLSSGLSPLVSLAYLCAALYAWAWMDLKRRKLLAQQGIDWPIVEPCEEILVKCQESARILDGRLQRTVPPRKSRFWPLFQMAMIPAAWFLASTLQPICEARGYGLIFLALVLFCLSLSAFSFYQFLKTWLILDSSILRRLDYACALAALRRIAPEVGWRPTRGFGWQIPRFRLMFLAYEKLKVIPHARALAEEIETAIALEKILAEDQDKESGRAIRAIQGRKKLQQAFSRAYEELAPYRSDPNVQDFFAVRIVTYLQPVVSHMRNSLVGALLSAFLVLLAVRTYAFEPKLFLSVAIWGSLLAAVTVTLLVFVQMERNPTLSAIGNTTAGEISFDRHFFTNVFTYGVIPLLGIVVSQFPEVGQYLVSWFNPLLQAVGVN